MNPSPPITWVLEADVFQSGDQNLRAAASALGHDTIRWSDDWWQSGKWPRLDGQAVVFRGSLENAARVRQQLPWRPGSFCDVAAFHCSAWYPRANPWLLHEEWRLIAADELAQDPAAVANLASPDTVFVRPDSPLKPFTGRAVPLAKLTLESLDYGFYFDDTKLPVIVAPIRRIDNEWRFVVAGGRVVAGSEYVAAGRQGSGVVMAGPVWEFGGHIARQLAPPEIVYVMDICQIGGQLRLLELNPFSGADLYDCPVDEVVRSVGRAAISSFLGA